MKRLNLSSDTVASALRKSTSTDVIYYVRTAGSDSNNGLSETYPFATIQYALDCLPTIITSDIVIDIGSGSFDGFVLTGFLVTPSGSLTIRGLSGSATLTTGSASGTAIDGTVSSLIDSEQLWTASELRGKFLVVDSEIRLIRANTDTTVDIVGEFIESPSGKTYTIVDQKSTVNTVAYSDSYGTTVLLVNGVYGSEQNIILQDLIVDGGSSTLRMYSSSAVKLSRLYLKGWTLDGVLTQGSINIRYCDLFASSSSSGAYGYGFSLIRGNGSIQRCLAGFCDLQSGFNLFSVQIFESDFWYVENTARNSTKGIIFYETTGELDGICLIQNLTGASGVIQGIDSYGTNFNFTGSVSISNIPNGTGASVSIAGPSTVEFNELTIEDVYSGLVVTRRACCIIANYFLDTSARYGIRSVFKSSLYLTNTASISNCTLDAVLAGNNSVIIATALTGEGNSAYGIDVETCSRVFIDSNTSITGASGDILIDDEVKTYASDFNDNKDVVLGVAGSIMQRVDGVEL